MIINQGSERRATCSFVALGAFSASSRLRRAPPHVTEPRRLWTRMLTNRRRVRGRDSSDALREACTGTGASAWRSSAFYEVPEATRAAGRAPSRAASSPATRLAPTTFSDSRMEHQGHRALINTDSSELAAPRQRSFHTAPRSAEGSPPPDSSPLLLVSPVLR